MRLYWRIKKDGKWTWKPVTVEFMERYRIPLEMEEE